MALSPPLTSNGRPQALWGELQEPQNVGFSVCSLIEPWLTRAPGLRFFREQWDLRGGQRHLLPIRLLPLPPSSAFHATNMD